MSCILKVMNYLIFRDFTRILLNFLNLFKYFFLILIIILKNQYLEVPIDLTIDVACALSCRHAVVYARAMWRMCGIHVTHF